MSYPLSGVRKCVDTKSTKTTANSVHDGIADEFLPQAISLSALAIHQLQHAVVDVHIHKNHHRALDVQANGLQVQHDAEELQVIAN